MISCGMAVFAEISVFTKSHHMKFARKIKKNQKATIILASHMQPF
jgi:hypothetical protein